MITLDEEPIINKHPLAECSRCPWNAEGKFVPSLIPKGTVKLTVLGEAPGSYEAKTGIPFTGPSGELLDRVLEHHGFSRKEVAFVNTAACRPPGKTEKPPKTAVAACAARLDADLKQANAPLILAVGATSAQTLLGDSRPISKLRVGGPRDTIYGPVIAAFHPAFCLRTADAFPSFVKDVGKLNGDLPEPWKLPQYKVFEDPRVALVALNRLLGVKRAVIDIEAASDKDIDDAHPEDYDLLCVGVAYAQGQAVVFGPKIFLDEECLNVFSKFLDTVPIDAWNGKFDLLGLTPLFGMKKLSRDGMLMSYCVDERPRQHGLKMRGVEDLGTPKYDEDIAQYTKGKDGSFANIPKDLLYKYNAYDVCVTWDEIDYLELRMSPEQHRLHSFLIDAANMLMHVEMSPLHFDLEYNEQLSQEYMELLTKSEIKINTHIGYDINPRSPMQIMQFFALNGMNIPTTEREFLEMIQPQCDEHIAKFIELLLENRKLTKTHGTYIKGLRKKVKDGRIRTTFSLHATTSGRVASRKPNLQNVDRRSSIRNQFIAGPGLILIQGDFSQIEGRVIAYLAQDRYLQEVFSDPSIDIFNNMCDQIWGSGNWDKENRVALKSIFYGFAYGRGAKSIAQELKKPVSYAQNLMNEFKSLIPEVVAWQAAIRREVLEEQFLTTPFGRKRTFHLITNDNVVDVLNEALSYKPQSIASDICLRAAIRLQPMLETEYDAYMKLLVHDAIVVECVPEVKDLVISTMKQEMIRSAEEFTDFVPFSVGFSSGYRLGEL